MPARGSYLTVDLDLVRRVIEVNYLGGVWCTRALLPLPPGGAARDGARRQPRLGRRHDRLRARRRIRRVQARPARVLRSLSSALRGTGIAVHSVLPGFVETEGFPQKNVLKSPLMRRFVIQPPQVADAVLRSMEKGKGEITVPWFPYRPISILQALAPGLVARFAGMSDYRPGSV